MKLSTCAGNLAKLEKTLKQLQMESHLVPLAVKPEINRTYSVIRHCWTNIKSKQNVTLIKDMYNNAMTSVRTNDGNTNYFPIKIGLHQGSALSPYLFALVMDEVTRDIQGDIPWCMPFANDVVLVDESQAGVNRKLELWRQALDSKGFRVSQTKTEYMRCEFGNATHEEGDASLGGQVVPTKDIFHYLGSMLQKDGDVGGEVLTCFTGLHYLLRIFDVCGPIEPLPDGLRR
jgi:hypothetical protein